MGRDHGESVEKHEDDFMHISKAGLQAFFVSTFMATMIGLFMVPGAFWVFNQVDQVSIYAVEWGVISATMLGMLGFAAPIIVWGISFFFFRRELR